MAIRFNPLTGNFDFTGSGGGGGGASYIDGEVQNFSALPTANPPAVDSAYLVREPEGTWLINRKPAGIYIRVATTGTRATDWTYAGILPDVFNDANFLLYDNADSSKNLAFQLSGITTGTTRTLTAPDASGTIARTEDFAAPPAIGGTTAAAGTFTTLTASTSLAVTGGIITGASNVIEQVSSTSAQTFRLYNTFTSATNHERGFLRWSSNVFQIGTEKGSGGGTARTVEILTDNTWRCRLQSEGLLLNGNGPRVYFGNPLISGDAESNLSLDLQPFGAGNVIIRSGLLKMNGTTASFPALKRNSTTLEVRLANDSGFAPLACGALTINGNLDASTRDIVTDTTTGTKIGTATSQKIGFFNATPVVQQAAVADATDAASTQARLNDLLARLRTLGLIAT
jgi:hypothetical protein